MNKVVNPRTLLPVQAEIGFTVSFLIRKFLAGDAAEKANWYRERRSKKGFVRGGKKIFPAMRKQCPEMPSRDTGIHRCKSFRPGFLDGQKSKPILHLSRFCFQKGFEQSKTENFVGRRKQVRRRKQDKKVQPKSETPTKRSIGVCVFSS